MPLGDLGNGDRRVVRLCMECVADGDVILHDEEFETVMGIDLTTLRAVLERWPTVDEADPDVRLAVNNSLNNLLGYPHAFQACWDERIPVTRSEVRRALSLWRGDAPTSYFDGLG